VEVSEVTIDEFHAEMKVAIDSFIVYWKFRNEGNPKLWPLDLKEDDWHEQWIAWLYDLQDRKMAALEEKE